MKKKIIIIISAVLIVLLGMGIVMSFNKVIDPATVMIKHAKLSNHTIELQGELMGSGDNYKGYEVSYKDGSVFIQLKGSSLALFRPRGSFDIQIPNSFGAVHAVYLENQNGDQQIKVNLSS
ncbi:hypothetical protein [Paenibacillus campi]|uniref:hypothetical protein n=1 Tax=Paenibacillus campi TaxID=3106031 RepID=UPI002AFEE3FE|nr:hypothetical protein [Paenibacillus sp. SGZ-1009]